MNIVNHENGLVMELIASEIDEELEIDILEYINQEIGTEEESLFAYFRKVSIIEVLDWIKEYEDNWNPNCCIFEVIKDEFLSFLGVSLDDVSNAFASDLHYGYIYKFINKVNGKVYVGKTTSLKTRITSHKNSANYDYHDEAIHRAIKKYGWDNFELTILDFADTKEELNEKEKGNISKFNSFAKLPNSHGYNQTAGGEGTEGVSDVLTIEDVIKIKEIIRDTATSIHQISKDFNVGSSTVYSIYWGKNWLHVKVNGFTPRMKRPDTMIKGEKFPSATISDSTAVKIKELLRDTSYSQVEIARSVGCKKNVVEHIFKGDAWRHINVEGFHPKMDRPNKKFKKNEQILTFVDVAKIKKLLIKGEKTHKEIANIFGVNREAITSINRGRIWKAVVVDGFIPTRGRGVLKGEKVKTSKLNERKVKQIKKLLNDGQLTMRQIALKFGVNPETIRKIRNGQMWKDVEI